MAFVFGAFHGTPLEYLPILLNGEVVPVILRHAEEFLGGLEVGFCVWQREVVPRTGFAASVAAINAIFEKIADFIGQFAPIFNGKIRQAPACVKSTFSQRFGGTGIKAGSAISAS